MLKETLTISELAHFSRISRDTLLYYDKIGLIKPAYRAANGYRYYSNAQIGVANLIRTFQSWGYTLEQIKEIVDNRSPEYFLETYQETDRFLKDQIVRLERARSVHETLHQMVLEATEVNEGQICCEYQLEETIFKGPLIDYTDGKSDYDGLVEFYAYCKQRDPLMDLNWSAWGYFSGERIARGDWHWPDRYYFRQPNSPDVKPAGYYVVAYTRGDYGHTHELYSRILAYLEQNDLTIIGDCYEDYILNEIVCSDPVNYLIRASIQVSEPRDLGKGATL